MTDETRTEPETPIPETPTAEAPTAEVPTAEVPAAEAPTAEGPAEEKPAKLPQNVELKDVGPCKKHVKITIDRSAIDERMNEKFSEMVSDSNMVVAGFRPGKAPRRIIERRFKKDVNDRVKAEVLLVSLQQLAEDHDVAPLTAPDIDPLKIEIPEQGPLIYEFEVEVRPQFDLPNYKGLSLRRPVRTFTDADVNREMRHLLEPYGQLVPKKPAEGETEAKVEDGDFVIVDIATRDGDRVLSQVKETKIRVEERLAFRDGVADKFGAQIIGAQAGDQRVVEVTLSDTVADPTLRSKTVQATFDIKDVKVMQSPELTHDLCHEFGVHSQEQLRELIRLVLDRRLLYEQRQAARQQVLQQIAAAGSWELPQDLLQRQTSASLRRRIMEMRSAGISEGEIRGRLRLLEKDVLNSTALALKEHFVMQKIAEVEKIDIDDDDIDAEIDRLAGQSDESPRKIRARLEKEDMMEALAAELIERKALDLVLESAEYEDVPVGASEDAARLATVEEQAVPGRMQDPMAAPEPEKKPEAGS